MNQETVDKLAIVRERMHVHQLEIWKQKKIQEDYYRDNMIPLVLEEQGLTRNCDHINPDGTSAILSQIMWGSRCTICGMMDEYLWEDVDENPNHPANKKEKLICQSVHFIVK